MVTKVRGVSALGSKHGVQKPQKGNGGSCMSWSIWRPRTAPSQRKRVSRHPTVSLYQLYYMVTLLDGFHRFIRYGWQ
jgi:hypothetical protein